jgi:hypothetical protein
MNHLAGHIKVWIEPVHIRPLLVLELAAILRTFNQVRKIHHTGQILLIEFSPRRRRHEGLMYHPIEEREQRGQGNKGDIANSLRGLGNLGSHISPKLCILRQ